MRQARKKADFLLQLVDGQSASGAFNLCTVTRQEFLSRLQADAWPKMQSHIKTANPARHRNLQYDTFIQTASIVVFLLVEYADSTELLELLIHKAQTWLQRNLPDGVDLDELLRVARECLLLDPPATEHEAPRAKRTRLA